MNILKMLIGMKRNSCLYLGSAFVCGWCLGLFFNDYSLFIYNYDIELFDVVSLFVTSSIGIYIAHTIQANVENKKTEKEIIFCKLDFIENVLTDYLSDVMQGKSLGIFKITGSIGTCRKNWAKLIEILKGKCHNDEESLKKIEGVDSLVRRNFINLNRLSTDEGVNDSSSIRVKNNRVTFKGNRTVLISNEIDIIRNTIVDFKFIINEL